MSTRSSLGWLACALALCVGCFGDKRDRDGRAPASSGESDQFENGLVRLREQRLEATVDGRMLRVRVPIERTVDQRVEGTLTLELRGVDDPRILDRTRLTYEISDDAEHMLVGRLSLDREITSQAELVGYTLRIVDGDLRVLRSAFAAHPRYEVRLEGPAHITADKAVSYRVRAHDPQTFAPIRSAPVSLTIVRDDAVIERRDAQTDEHGDAFFPVVLAEAGKYGLRAGAELGGTHAQLSDGMAVERASARMLLTTDKPAYQPGQRVFLRALALDPAGRKPLAALPVVFEIEDAQQNRIIRRSVLSDDYGIASLTVSLANALNLGTFRARVTSAEATSERSFEVSRHRAPKFALQLDLERDLYRAGDSARGKLTLRTLFGHDVASASVVIEARLPDAAQTVARRCVGKTAADGTLDFELELPSAFVGYPVEQGHVLMTLHVVATDPRGLSVEKDLPLIAATEPAHVVVVPEAGLLVPGLENELRVFVSDPLGKPLANQKLALSLGEGAKEELVTDGFGQATLRATIAADTSSVRTELQLEDGSHMSRSASFALQAGLAHLMVRSDRAVYALGETAHLDVTSTEAEGSIYVDWRNDGQAVDQRTLVLKDGRASFEVTLDGSRLGANRIETSVLDGAGNLVHSGTTLFVREASALSVELSTDRTRYLPGESAQLTFSVKDEAGHPSVAALGVTVLDEQVFDSIAARPTLLRTYFELDDALNSPRYQLPAPPGDLARILYEDTRAPEQAARDAAQARARAMFAALGTRSIAGIGEGSWSATLEQLRGLLAPVYMHEHDRLLEPLTKVVSAGFSELARDGCRPEDAYCDAREQDYLAALRAYVRDHLAAFDPWGTAYALRDDADSALRFVTRGPDEVSDSDDDAVVVVPLSDLALAALSSLPRAADDHSGGDMRPSPSDAGFAIDPRGPVFEQEALRAALPEPLYVNPALISGPDGQATLTLPAFDAVTDFRVAALANSRDGRLGGNAHAISVFEPLSLELEGPATLTRGDQISLPVMLVSHVDEPQQVTVSLDGAPFYTALGATSAALELAPKETKRLSFVVRVDTLGLHTFNVHAKGSLSSDTTRHSVRVVPEGRAVSRTRSGLLGPSEHTEQVSFPPQMVEDSGELVLEVFPSALASVVRGMENLLRAPCDSVEEATSATWVNVLALRYLRDTKQNTADIELAAQGHLNTGYQKLLTYQHPGGGFSWFGPQDGAPDLEATAFAVLELADMAEVYEIDPTQLSRTISWLLAQQDLDGSFRASGSQLVSASTHALRSTALVVWALANAGNLIPEAQRGLAYLRAHYAEETRDAFTLALLANTLAMAAPSDPLLASVLAALDATKNSDAEHVWWDPGSTVTSFYGQGAITATTALVAHARLVLGDSEQMKPALAYLEASRAADGSFGSTQATVWALRALIRAAQQGARSAVGELAVRVDGKLFDELALNDERGAVTTSFDLSTLATKGDHEVTLAFAGTGELSYSLTARHHLPWDAQASEPSAPLHVQRSYDRSLLAVNETVSVQVGIENVTEQVSPMVSVELGVPPGFEVVSEDLDTFVQKSLLSRYEVTPTALRLLVREIGPRATQRYDYRLRATLPVKASDGGARVHPCYANERESFAEAHTLEVIE